MKKLLSVIFAVVMLLGCASAAFATGQTITLSTGVNTASLEYTDDTLIVPAGVTYTNEGTIKLNRGAIIVNAGGSFENKGTLIVDDNTSITIKGAFNNYVTLPASTDMTYAASTPTFDRANHTVTYTYNYLLASAMSTDSDYLDITKYTSSTEIAVPYGDTLYVMVGAKEGSKDANYIDTSRVKLTDGAGIVNSSAVTNTRRGVFAIEPQSAASYNPVSLKYADVVTQFKIELPAKEDVYTVKTDKGETGTVTLNYGEMLTVTVELAPEYDESETALYISSVELTPDKYGYFDINVVYADDGSTLIVNSKNGTVSQDGTIVTTYGVRAPFSIMVMPPVKNETKQKFNSVLTYIKQIFDVLREVFNSIKEALSGLFG